jgi:hypothetical protein
LMCAAPLCGFLVHTQPEFGGFCCRKCHWIYKSGSNPKKKHGQCCEENVAPPDAVKSQPIPPTEQ